MALFSVAAHAHSNQQSSSDTEEHAHGPYSHCKQDRYCIETEREKLRQRREKLDQRIGQECKNDAMYDSCRKNIIKDDLTQFRIELYQQNRNADIKSVHNRYNVLWLGSKNFQ